MRELLPHIVALASSSAMLVFTLYVGFSIGVFTSQIDLYAPTTFTLLSATAVLVSLLIYLARDMFTSYRSISVRTKPSEETNFSEESNDGVDSLADSLAGVSREDLDELRRAIDRVSGLEERIESLEETVNEVRATIDKLFGSFNDFSSMFSEAIEDLRSGIYDLLNPFKYLEKREGDQESSGDRVAIPSPDQSSITRTMSGVDSDIGSGGIGTSIARELLSTASSVRISVAELVSIILSVDSLLSSLGLGAVKETIDVLKVNGAVKEDDPRYRIVLKVIDIVGRNTVSARDLALAVYRLARILKISTPEDEVIIHSLLESRGGSK